MSISSDTKPGTRVVVTTPKFALEHKDKHGVVVSVKVNGTIRVKLDGEDVFGFYPTSLDLEQSQVEVAEPIVVGGPVRDYDFNRGDRRFTEALAAIEHAHKRSVETGKAQSIRPVSAPHFVGGPFYLVQEVGA